MYTRSLFLLLLLLLSAHPSTLAQDESNGCGIAIGTPLRIGAIFAHDDLFGVAAGNPYRGVQAIVDTVNYCGGVNGHPVELVYIAANNREQAQEAVAQLPDDISLVIGSGSLAVSEVLSNAASDQAFIYWEVTEALSPIHQPQFAFSPLPGNFLIGMLAADFINGQVISILDSQTPRMALINENRDRAQLIADGIKYNLVRKPVIEHTYNNDLNDSYSLAVDFREENINIVVIAAFENDTDRLWYDLREADANIKAWIQVGGADYRLNTCDRLGNTDGLISISTTGAVSTDYRLSLDPIYEKYLAWYREYFAAAPDENADLAASGVYLLLRHVLPQISADWTTENIRVAITSTEIMPPAGLMGEGFFIPENVGENGYAVAVAQQRQDNQFCTVSPSSIATCSQPLQALPTWRERVTQAQFASCG